MSKLDPTRPDPTNPIRVGWVWVSILQTRTRLGLTRAGRGSNGLGRGLTRGSTRPVLLFTFFLFPFSFNPIREASPCPAHNVMELDFDFSQFL